MFNNLNWLLIGLSFTLGSSANAADDPFFSCAIALSHLNDHTREALQQLDRATAELDFPNAISYTSLAPQIKNSLLDPDHHDAQMTKAVVSVLVDYAKAKVEAPIPANERSWETQNTAQKKELWNRFRSAGGAGSFKDSSLSSEVVKLEELPNAKTQTSLFSTAEMPVLEVQVEQPGYLGLTRTFVPLVNPDGQLNLRAFDLYRKTLAAMILEGLLDPSAPPLIIPMGIAMVNKQLGVISHEYKYLKGSWNRRGEVVKTKADLTAAIESGLSPYAIHLAEIFSFLLANQPTELTHFLTFRDSGRSYDRLIVSGVEKGFGPWIHAQSDLPVVGSKLPETKLSSTLKQGLTYLDQNLSKILGKYVTAMEIDALRFRIQTLLKADEQYRLDNEVKTLVANHTPNAQFAPYVPRNHMETEDGWFAWVTGKGKDDPETRARNKVLYVTLVLKGPVSAKMIAGFAGVKEEIAIDILNQWSGNISASHSQTYDTTQYFMTNDRLRYFLNQPGIQQVTGITIKQAHGFLIDDMLSKLGLGNLF